MTGAEAILANVLTRAVGAAFADAQQVVRGETATHRHLRDRLTAIAALTLAIDLLASALVLHFEDGEGRARDITSFGDAIFWTTSQLLTVSSSMENPVTLGGRIIDVGLELYAITVVAALAGSFGAFFHRRGHERDPV